MSEHEFPVQISAEEALLLLEFTEIAVRSGDLGELAQGMLPILIKMMGVPAAILYLEESKIPIHSLFQEGIQFKTLPSIKRICTEQYHQIPIQSYSVPLILSLAPQEPFHLVLFFLYSKKKKLGFLGALTPEPEKLTGKILAGKVTFLLSYFIEQFLDRLGYEKRIANLNTYLAVSSKISQTLNLREVIETVLYSSMEAVPAEAASVLLLDSEKKNFRFYGVEGPAKPFLLDVTFPADQGLAGYVLQNQQSTIFNDVQRDPHFYKKFDYESGFQTRNMVAIPLVAGDERIGVLEVLNKAGGELFHEDDRLLLQSIAEEIAFAIHNANLFEEKQRLAAEIQRMHQFQTELIQTSNDGIIANDQRGNIIVFNEGAERILGYRQDEVIGKINVAQLYPPGLAQEIRARIAGPEYGGAGRLIHYETIGVSKTGEQIPVELSASPIYENDHEVVTVGFFRDLRERKQLQEKLLHSERLAALGQMAAHISHEVKNPLMVIGGIARQVLKSSADDQEKNREKLKVIVEEIRRLEDFLADVGSFAKLSEAKKGAVNPNSLIQEMALQFEPSLCEKNIKLSLNLDPNLPQVQFDPLHLRQVLLNIAKNSIEAMQNGGNLIFTSEYHKEGVLVQITDTGEGIPPDIIDRIFQPFYSTKPKGSGLGLAISKTIIEAYQGKIEVESKSHHGTCTTVFLKVN
jgi:PAS domain S-box-containing protein